MLSPETIKVLTVPAVLLTLVLLMGAAWIRDRNARIRDLKEQVEAQKATTHEWREAYFESEKSRGLDRESTRAQIEVMRTNEAVIAGLRNALERRENDA